MRECAMNGEFDNSLQSDMQDLTKKIKDLNQQYKETEIERDNSVSGLAELQELCDKLTQVKNNIIDKNKSCSLEVTQPNFAD